MDTGESAERAKYIITWISWYGKSEFAPRLRNLVGKCIWWMGELSYITTGE